MEEAELSCGHQHAGGGAKVKPAALAGRRKYETSTDVDQFKFSLPVIARHYSGRARNEMEGAEFLLVAFFTQTFSPEGPCRKTVVDPASSVLSEEAHYLFFSCFSALFVFLVVRPSALRFVSRANHSVSRPQFELSNFLPQRGGTGSRQLL